MTDLRLHYSLPCSALHFTGTATETTDALAPTPKPDRAASGAVELITVAERRRLTLTVDADVLQETTVSFELTDDGRLTSADVSRAGQGAKVALGVVTAAVHVLTGVVGGGGLVGAVPAFTLTRAPGGEEPKGDPVGDAYRKEHGDEAKLRAGYRQAVVDALEAERAAAAALLEADDGGPAQAAQERWRRARLVLGPLRAELERLDAHFAAWRAGKVHQTTESYDVRVTLDTLRGSGVRLAADGASFSFSDDAAGAEVRRVWEQLGLAVLVEPMGEAAVTDPPRAKDTILVREPRVATLKVYERGPGGRPRLQRKVESLVMDSACEDRELTWAKSWFAKHQRTLRFSPLGALTAITQGDSAAAAALADAVSATPAAVATARDQQLALAKTALALQQTQVAQAGVAATAGDFAELERLKQEAAILAQRKLLSEPSAGA